MASTQGASITYGDVTLHADDLQLLDPPNWMNDNLMSFYITYLKRELYPETIAEHNCALLEPSVSFWFLQATTEDVVDAIFDLSLHSKDWVFVPISDHTDILTTGGTHWTALVLNIDQAKGFHFDSGQVESTANYNNARAFARKLLEAIYLKNGEEVAVELELSQSRCTKQTNGYNCGYHTCATFEAVLQAMNSGVPVYPDVHQLENIASYPPQAAEQVRERSMQKLAALLQQQYT
eukprot:gb/GECG01003504.1/.p1 GENE.gb/GECG01003504.1/~~gb/GECG01003504.1/.p1  ORF type:complete len:236 (+),score=29.52 gb/GECG01003504.1/:1-708(+)